MLRILKANPILLLVLPVLLGGAIWAWVALLPGSSSFYGDTMPMFNTFFRWISYFPIGALVLGFAVLLLEAFTLNSFINKHSLLKQSSYLPAFFYILFCSCRHTLICFYPSLVASLFLILALRRLAESYKKEKALSELFDAGLFIGIAALVYVPVIVFVLFLWIAVLVMRSLNWRDWIVSLIGFALPFIFAMGYFTVFYSPEHFWYDRIMLAFGNYKLGLSMPWKGMLLFICLIITAIVSSWFYINKISDNILKAQKVSILMLWFVFFALASIVLSPEKNARSFVILAMPFSYMFSNYFIKTKSKALPEMLFIFFIVTIVLSVFF
jgi:hypothetical protein